ncbi:protein mono-ADP-ribosyltransferase PARP12-like [Centroberyx affinis]|uniref:protein mono-ADP-ribosyltransferase PARP12-like n=1 Tax=Centroberyx affinis TaxID=166261 RepID=UPI003A5C1C9D
MTESAVMKFICANQGSVNIDELVFIGCFGDSQDVREIISNREKFAWCSSGGQQKVVAKTEVRLCKAKDCQGCSSLHLCKKFLLGSCQFSQTRRRCRFSHDLKSAHNVKILREHELEDLDLKELCTLLLQNDNFFLPPICHDYNNGDGPYGRCQDGDGCNRLHICEKHLKGVCSCPRTHDFYDPQPLKTLQGRGMPDHLIRSMKSVYMNIEALRSKGNRGNNGNHQLQQRACSTSDILAAVHATAASSDDTLNRRQRQRPKKSQFAKDKTEICLYFIKGHCKHGERCLKVHEKLPYRWQVRQGQQWTALPDNEEIEKDYCDPEKTYSSHGSQTVCFDTMTCGSNKVRRLSTASSVLHPTFVLTTEWVWYWEDEFRNWNLYTSATGGRLGANISSAELEQKFLNDEKNVVEFKAGSQTYSLNFQDMIQTNKQYGTKRLVRRRPVFVSSADAQTKKVRKPVGNQSNFKAVPAHWDKTQIPLTGFKRVSLQSSSVEYQEIEGLFCNTMRGFDIVQIERIQNKALWEVFEWQKDRMKNNNSGRNVMERKLFHGTDSKHVDAICVDNFDWRICGTHGTSFGKGSYFARDAKYSHRYTGQSDVRSMFISRVLVGDFTRGSSNYLRPPSKDSGDTRFYDSCVDNIRDPSIFVVFEKHQIYPEYLLQYKKTSNPLRWYNGAASVPAPAAVPPRGPYPSLGTSVPRPSRPVPLPSTPVSTSISQYHPPSAPVSTPIKPVPSASAPFYTPFKPVPSPSVAVSTPISQYHPPSAPVSTPIKPVLSPSAPVSTLIKPVPSPSTPVSTPIKPVPSHHRPVSVPLNPFLSPSTPVSTLIKPVPSPSAPVSTPVIPVPSPSAPGYTPTSQYRPPSLPVSTPVKPVASPHTPVSTSVKPVPSPSAPHSSFHTYQTSSLN